MAAWENPRTPSILKGLALRSQIIDCPLHAFAVKVSRCNGAGECAAVCPVDVFGTDALGRCMVFYEELCFGCMACVAQCAERGVTVTSRDARKYPSVEDLFR